MWKTVFVIAVAFIAAAGVLGFERGWFSFDKSTKLDVKVDPEKFKQDKSAFKTMVGDKTKAMKLEVEELWKKSEGLTGDAKTRAEKDLSELKNRHKRIEAQLKELEDAGEDKFQSLREDLRKDLEAVELKIAEVKKSLENKRDK